MSVPTDGTEDGVSLDELLPSRNARTKQMATKEQIEANPMHVPNSERFRLPKDGADLPCRCI